VSKKEGMLEKKKACTLASKKSESLAMVSKGGVGAIEGNTLCFGKGDGEGEVAPRRGVV